MKFYVYTLASSLDNKIFYVGKGTNDERMYIHEYLAKYNKHYNKHLQNKIKKIWGNGGQVIKNKIFESNIEQKCFDHEIEKIGKIGIENLCNLTRGGTGAQHSKETKKKMSENHADIFGEKNSMYGKTHSEKTKKKMSKSLTGRKHTNETKKKMSENRIGIKFSDKWKMNLCLAAKKRWLEKPISNKTREKMSLAQKKRWANNDT